MDINSEYDVLSHHFNQLVIDQEETVNGILVNLKLREMLSAQKKYVTSLPLNMLVRGSSGVGKTHAIRLICKELGLPFIATNITDYTASGYTGNSLNSVLESLLYDAQELVNQEKAKTSIDLDEINIRTSKKEAKAPKSDLAKSIESFINSYESNKGGKKEDPNKPTRKALKLTEQKAVVFFDEFDKLFFKTDNYNIGTTGVIREVLGYLSWSEVMTKFGVVDTANIIFICAGAFDMVSFKDIPTEILGRLSTRVKMNKPTANTFMKMLQSEELGLLIPLKAMLNAKGVTDVIFPPDVVTYVGETLATHEHNKAIGIRRLTSFIAELIKHYFVIPKFDETTVIITRAVVADCLNKVNKGIIDDD